MTKFFFLFSLIFCIKLFAENMPPGPPGGTPVVPLSSENPLPKKFSVYSCHGIETDKTGARITVGFLFFCHGLYEGVCPAQISVLEKTPGAHLPKLYKAGINLSRGFNFNGDLVTESKSQEYAKSDGYEFSAIKLSIDKKERDKPKAKAKLQFKLSSSDITLSVECHLADYKK